MIWNLQTFYLFINFRCGRSLVYDNILPVNKSVFYPKVKLRMFIFFKKMWEKRKTMEITITNYNFKLSPCERRLDISLKGTMVFLVAIKGLVEYLITSYNFWIIFSNICKISRKGGEKCDVEKNYFETEQWNGQAWCAKLLVNLRKYYVFDFFSLNSCPLWKYLSLKKIKLISKKNDVAMLWQLILELYCFDA